MTKKNIYFVGIGGIGMSNLARYYISQGCNVAGYDRSQTTLTNLLTKEGAVIHYEDDVSLIPSEFLDPATTLVIYTPAIPVEHKGLSHFKSNGFTLMKRAQVLGEITKNSKAVCVAGTHGKTTVSSMTAHLIHQSTIDCNAFLGGIVSNYNTNLILSDNSEVTVVEADEYDRSFHWLKPYIAIITSADPDHLDIYGTAEAYRESFEHFTSLIRNDGWLLMRKDIAVTPRVAPDVKILTYSETEGDMHAENIRISNGQIKIDFISPMGVIRDIELGVPVRINIENAIAAIGASLLVGVTESEIRRAMQSFGGIKRRFEFIIKEEPIVFIDDYAHHPHELGVAIDSIKTLYKDRKVTGVFQPHLYTRTRDFIDEFAASLSQLDQLILLDIYPAREKPIPGVTSELLFDKVSLKKEDKHLSTKEESLSLLEDLDLDIVVTFGAGDIDQLLPDIERLLRKKYLSNN